MVSAGLVVLGVSDVFWAIAAGMALFGLGYGLVFPAAAAMATAATGAARRGTAFGMFYAVYSLGVVVGATGSGRLAELPTGFAGYPFPGGCRRGARGHPSRGGGGAGRGSPLAGFQKLSRSWGSLSGT